MATPEKAYVSVMKQSGVYQVVNRITKKVYVGSAVDLHKRVGEHFRDLQRGKHINKHLQASYKKHGSKAFSFHILEFCPPEKLLEVEQNYLDATMTVRPVYNICPTAGNCQGRPVKPETIAKLRGQKRSAETRERIRKHALTRVQSEATKEKLRLLKTGKKYGEAFRAKMRQVVKKNTYDIRLLSPHGIEHGPITNLKHFAELNGLCPSHLYGMVSGKRLSHRKWRLLSGGHRHAAMDLPRK